MLIIATVSIMAVYNSKIVKYGINGTQDYATEGINENNILEGTEKVIDSVVDNIKQLGKGSEPETSKPEKPTELTIEELAREEMIGKYVDYKSQGTNYPVDGTYSGTGMNQTFESINSMKWRIWGVEGNKLLLISETVAGNIELKGANGYNNAVKILNDACNIAFGNPTYDTTIKVRSINQDDIDKVTRMTTDEQRKVVHSIYGTTATPNYYEWPNIYGQEPGKIGGGDLDRSSQINWITGITNSSFTGKDTYYNYNVTSYATQTMYDALLTNMNESSTSGTSSHTAYWIASRCILIGSNYAYFRIFVMEKGNVFSYNLYRSNGNIISNIIAVRPIAEVNLDRVSIGATGLGTSSNPYTIIKK